MVLSVAFVSFLLRCMSHPTVSHVMPFSFSRPFQLA